MDALRHVIIVAVIAVVFRWLWRSSRVERARVEAGGKVFPPTRAIGILVSVIGIALIFLVVLTSYLGKPDEWWVPYGFLGFLVLVPFMYPPVLTIGVAGLERAKLVQTGRRLGFSKSCNWQALLARRNPEAAHHVSSESGWIGRNWLAYVPAHLQNASR